ncbi:MAG: hypothetical protein AAGC76_09610 [Luteibacter sp.]|uniref:hypothetical protein n=1 Tax=Luteibacter sp. TaxID=1886636 RepID=UPI0028089879|nr:hypothetical protein [Luteibacter sp.]MDQ7996097.1 hypothetical protein [Luteibacter sp.]
MEIKVRNRNFNYAEVLLVEGSMTIDLGSLNEREKNELANAFRVAAYELDDIECVTKESALDAIRSFEDEGNSGDVEEAESMLVDPV